jgi:MFS transporter, DHA1 family, multidrug resistance protein
MGIFSDQLQYSLLELPVYLSAWTAACFWGPAIGPLIAGFAVQANGWRWGLYEIIYLSVPAEGPLTSVL